jgi:hypothetical protein
MTNIEKVDRIKALMKQLDLGRKEAVTGLVALLRDRSLVLPPDILGGMPEQARRTILLAGFATIYSNQ